MRAASAMTSSCPTSTLSVKGVPIRRKIMEDIVKAIESLTRLKSGETLFVNKGRIK